MYRVIECLAQEHHYGLVAVAALVCMVGSVLTVMVKRRMIAAIGLRKRFQVFLASLLGGATIWSTHFIAMLAYDPGFQHSYEPVLTGMSLLVAVLGLIAVNAIFAYRDGRRVYWAAGAGFGMTVSTMHYVGMASMYLPGSYVWDPSLVFVSVILGMILGAAAYHRIVHPVLRYCWLGGAALLVLSICTMHFTGMGAFTVELSPLVEVPPKLMPDAVLALVVFAVTGIILFIGFVSISIEINIEAEARAKIEKSATHDALTGLPNRLLLSKRMDDKKARLETDTGFRVGVLTIDLDRFKEINDLHGHIAGDAVLMEVARRLEAACEKGEFVARTGGDEFVALKSEFRRIDEVRAFAERLHVRLIEPIQFRDLDLAVGASVGVATTLEDGRDLNDLLQKSDLAMYRAKAETDSVCFFNAAMDQQNRERLSLVHDLRHAAEAGQFELVYQLQNDVASLKPSGFEVLLRWDHPKRGRISPGEFIPIAEKTGLIRDVGLWVLRTACREAASWSKPYSIAVNVAPQQLAQPSFLENLSDILMETRLEPNRLELEITEASIIDDQAYTLKVMHRIKEMGVRIAMDDFGTGYSSLATLQAFPFDKIKIDRSFIQDVHVDEQRAAIVRSTLLLGQALKIPVLAEGVESESELNFLKSEKCIFVQGFYFGKPLHVDELRKVVDAPTTQHKTLAS